jgi:serine phosphatase RsbU (regulator of sigma subunit)
MSPEIRTTTANRFAPTRTADIGVGALDDMLARLTPQRIEAGEVLVRQGDKSEFAYFVSEGSLAVFAESDYERVQLAALEAPRLIGELGVLAGYPRTATIETVTPVTLYRLTADELIEVGRRAPDFLFSVISQLGRQIDGMNQALTLYGNALSALERREFDARIIDDLAHPSPQLVTFAATFKRFAEQIVDKRRQTDDLASAALIQRSFLPRAEQLRFVSGVLDLSADMRPARDVGGDFYDYFMLDDRRVAIAIGDVCGKGIPAALFMAVAITALRNAAQRESDVASTLTRVNEALCRDNDANMFATLFYGVLDLRSGVLEYGNCGHNAPYVLSGGKRKALANTGIPVGLMADRALRSALVVLNPGDSLVLFTDGVTEAMNPVNEEFGKDRLEALLDGSGALPAADLLKRIYADVEEFAAGEDQADDITCLTLRLAPSQRLGSLYS